MTTTTLTSSASTTDADAMSTADEHYPARVTRGRAKLWLAVFISCLAAVAALSWAGAKWAMGARQLAQVDKFTVEPRTFNVVLNEKGELKAAKSTDIISEVEGRSTIIYLIPEGTAVKKGDLLVELASDEIEDRIRQEELKEANAITAYEAAKAELDIQRDKNASDIRKAELDIELKQLALDKYEKGDWVQALKDANIEIERATIALERAKEDYQAAKELLAKDFITKTEYEQDEFNYKKAGWDLEKAKKALEVLESYTHVAELRQRESDLQEATKECARVKKNAEAEELKKLRDVEGKKKELDLIQDQLAKLRSQKEKCRIFAPTQGLVVYYAESWRWGNDQQIKEGASVHERQIILQLPDTSEMKVVSRIHETKTDKLSLGQPVNVTVEGLPGKQFSGRVSKIAVVADSQNRWLNPDLKEYETEISLEQTNVPLKPGVTAYVEILVENVADSLAVPVQTVYTKGRQRYVFRDTGGQVIPIGVQLGAIGAEWAEITDGLSGGEQILLAFSEEHCRLVPDAAPGANPGPSQPPSAEPRHRRTTDGDARREKGTAFAEKERKEDKAPPRNHASARETSKSIKTP